MPSSAKNSHAKGNSIKTKGNASNTKITCKIVKLPKRSLWEMVCKFIAI